MDKAIEAAALAVWARRHPSGRVSLPDGGALRDAVYADVEAAIAAYRAASGEARDAFKAEYPDLQSHARALLAVVERMEHSELCPANYCIKPAITGDECCQIEHAHRRIPDHAFQGGPCSCPLGELRRGLEVML